MMYKFLTKEENLRLQLIYQEMNHYVYSTILTTYKASHIENIRSNFLEVALNNYGWYIGMTIKKFFYLTNYLETYLHPYRELYGLVGLLKALIHLNIAFTKEFKEDYVLLYYFQWKLIKIIIRKEKKIGQILDIAQKESYNYFVHVFKDYVRSLAILVGIRRIERKIKHHNKERYQNEIQKRISSWKEKRSGL